jgi:alkanesulfonate monooxygenase SsuD/methylene tetrahydromethanopterin reductase-like flavin-dependent oxidoreductase (luciferase family)
MAHELRFQVLVLPKVPWPEYLNRFTRLEDLGFDVAAAPDHFCDWGNPSGPWLEAWTCLAAIAARTSTIRLTTCVTQIPLRNPAVLAHQAVTVDQISGGRLEIGLGTGLTIDPSYDMIGVPNWTNRERAERFGEYVELLDQLLAEGVTTYKGTFYEANGAVMNPGSVQQPRLPIMVAALGPRMMRCAVQHADIWNSLSFAADFTEQLAELVDRCMTIDELCAELGRDPASLRRSYTMFDPNARASGGAINYYESEDAFVDMVRQVIDLGITEISLYYPAVESQMRVFERIANDVLPVLRRDHA